MVALSDRPLMTAAEYLEWERNQEIRYEFWDGVVVAMAGGTRTHNRVCLNAARLLDEALADRGCEVYMADVKVQVAPGQKYFYPDVVVTCSEQDRDELMVNCPCLIVEVLSDSTEAVDRGAKFQVYRRFTTLQEYVLVRTNSPGVEVFTRNERGRWVLSEYGLGEVMVLESIGCEVLVERLYERVQFADVEG